MATTSNVSADGFTLQKQAAGMAGYHNFDIIMHPHTIQAEISNTAESLDAVCLDPDSETCREYTVGHHFLNKATRVFTLAADPSDYELFSSIMGLEHVSNLHSKTAHVSPEMQTRSAATVNSNTESQSPTSTRQTAPYKGPSAPFCSLCLKLAAQLSKAEFQEILVKAMILFQGSTAENPRASFEKHNLERGTYKSTFKARPDDYDLFEQLMKNNAVMLVDRLIQTPEGV